MTPVKQNRFGLNVANEPSTEAPGNCYAACIASILDIPLEHVPDELEFWKPGMKPIESWRPYEKKLHRWLHDNHKLIILEMPLKVVMYNGPLDCFDNYCVLSGPSPRDNKVLHAVVASGRNLVHDPHPENKFLAGDSDNWWVELFVRTGR